MKKLIYSAAKPILLRAVDNYGFTYLRNFSNSNHRKMNSGPLILIEDDADDKAIFEENFHDLGVKNEVIWFDNSITALEFLRTNDQQPFLIMCDINMPVLNGLELKSQIDNDPELKKKSIPFIFYSTSVNQHVVEKAYKEMTVQGFFQKGNNYEEIKNNLKIIIDYWTYCKHPNSY